MILLSADAVLDVELLRRFLEVRNPQAAQRAFSRNLARA